MSDHDVANSRDITQIKALKNEPMKTFVVKIDQGTDERIKYLYEAVANAVHDSECSVTVYTYIGSSDEIQYAVEKKGKWNSSFDATAVAAAAAATPAYTLDGFYKG